MAKINSITRSNPLSNYRNVAAQGGLGFAAMADVAKTAYDWLAPAAMKEQEERGRELGRQIAAGQMETSSFAYSSKGGEGIPDGYMSAVIGAESGGNPNAKNPNSSATGLGQFTTGTWRRMMEKYPELGLTADGRTDPAQSRRALDAFTQENRGALSSAGIPITGGTLYAAHFLGAGGAKTVLRADDGAALSSLLPAEVISANPFLKGKNVGWFRNWAERKGGGGNGHMSTSDLGTRTTLRQADGKLVSRLFSPLAGPILQAHNAAASVAYQSQVLNAGIATLNSMQNEHQLDPEGFLAASKQYVDDLVKQAPDQLKGQLREKLEQEAMRSHLGVVDAKHRDTRQRAINASGALVDRYASQLADAIAAGDPKDIAGAREQLADLLTAREALPGLSWTPEQSANAILKAEEQGERLIAAQQKEQAATDKAELEVIIKAAKNGQHADNEEILNDPDVQARNPELAREAAAYTILRDNTPDLLKLTPKEMRAVADQMRSEAVSEEWEVDVTNAMDTIARESAKAWEADPIKRAEEVLDEKPPRIGVPEGDMGLFLKDLQARKEYGDGLKEQGYTRKPVYFSEAEAQAFGAVFSDDMPPEYRVAAAAAVTSVFGNQAGAVLGQLGAKGAIVHGASLMAAGGDQNVAAAALRGEQMIEEGLVQLPTKPDRIAAYDTETGAAFLRAPGGVQAEAQVMEFAKAIYASQAKGVQPGSDQSDALMEQAIQTALGQSKNAQGEVTGGVQEVMGQKTLLPMGVNGEQLDQALGAAFGAAALDPSMGALELTARAISPFASRYGEPRADIWAKAGASVPMIHGQPLSGDYLDKGNVRLVPAPTADNPNLYRMEFDLNGRILNVEDDRGMVFYFDAGDLLDATR